MAKMLTREAQENYHSDDGPGVPTYMGPEVIRNFENYTALLHLTCGPLAASLPST